MPTVRFTGRVLPTALSVSIANRPTFHWKADELGLDMSFQVHIQDGSILIDCEVNTFEGAYLVPLFMRAYDLARAAVDLAAFSSGNGLTAVLDTFTDPTGAMTQLTAQQPSLAALATAVKIGTRDFDKVLQFVLAEPALFMALRDLVEAITSPHRAKVNCARAIRALTRFFDSPLGSREAMWLALRDKLQINKSYVQRITQALRGPTWEDRTVVPASGTNDVLHRTWVVMNRFFEYLKRDGQPLPLSEFPLLT